MVKTKQMARKMNTPGMSTYQDDSTSSSSSGEEVDTDAEESRQKGDKPRYNWPIFTGGEGKVTQAPKGGRIKRKVILEYSSDEVSESQLDQISPEYPTAADVAKIEKTKKSVKLTIPCHPTVEGLTKSFIAWYKDHGMTTSLRKALEANGWTERMIHEFKWVYIRKYKISQDYVMRYPDEKLSDEDELEEGGLANLVGPRREQHPKDPEKGADGSTSERTTQKKKAKKTSPSDLPREGKKKTVKCKRGQGNEPGSVTSKAPPEKKQKGERKKKKKRKAETDAAWLIPKKKKAKGDPLSCPQEGAKCGTTASAGSATRSCPGGRGTEAKHGRAAGGPSAQCGPPGHSGLAKPDCTQSNGAPGPGHGRFLGQTQKIYPPGQSTTGVGGHSCSEAAQAVLDTSSCG